MVDETIRSIKEAEQQAEEILVKAQEQKEQILKDGDSITWEFVDAATYPW